MVPKCNGHWHLCGDYPVLNLMRTYSHIFVAPENISETAVTTPFGLDEFLRIPEVYGPIASWSQFRPHVYQ